MKVITQKSNNKFWTDETGQQIPYNRTTKIERLMERKSAKLLKDAQKINKTLTDFKQEISIVCQEIYESFMIDKGVDLDDRKGNFTWYNFNRKIKIEVSINQRITFDDLSVEAAKEKFNAFLNNNLEIKEGFIKQMVMDAFETSRGKLDARKIFGLIRYKDKIKNELFLEAIALLEQSVRRPESKTYFRVWLLDSNGDYKNIDLNFSSI